MSLPILFPIRPKSILAASLPLPISSAIATPTPAPINPPVGTKPLSTTFSKKPSELRWVSITNSFSMRIHLHTFGQFCKLDLHLQQSF